MLELSRRRLAGVGGKPEGVEEIETIIHAHNQAGPQSEMAR